MLPTVTFHQDRGPICTRCSRIPDYCECLGHEGAAGQAFDGVRSAKRRALLNATTGRDALIAYLATYDTAAGCGADHLARAVEAISGAAVAHSFAAEELARCAAILEPAEVDEGAEIPH